MWCFFGQALLLFLLLLHVFLPFHVQHVVHVFHGEHDVLVQPADLLAPSTAGQQHSESKLRERNYKRKNAMLTKATKNVVYIKFPHIITLFLFLF